MNTSSRRVRGPFIGRALLAGFTLVEIVIALAVLGTMAGGCYIGFNAVNAYAVSSRLYSEAQAVAQNQIDLILSKGPFNITSVVNGFYRVPLVLCMDPATAAGPECKETAATTGPHTQVTPNVFIYRDPVTGRVLVTGTMSTTITAVPATLTYGGVTSNLNIRRATVKVNYSWRNKNYEVALDTLRTADQ
jgi:prepilin-type N-terminal cleavage/methylation domain-containing protein